MTILAALQSAGIRLVGRRPGTFFGAQGQFELEITDLANEVAADISKYQDWQALIKTYQITGTGTQNDFPLPDDYDRMLVVTDVQNSTNWLWGYYGFVDINDYLLAQERGFAPWPGGWIIYGDRFRFSPPPAAANQALFPYITKNWALGQDSVSKPAFTADTDSFLLPERLLTLGLIWRWRENKKLDASGDQEAFIKAMDEYAAKDAGSKVLRFGGRHRRFANTAVPYMGFAY